MEQLAKFLSGAESLKGESGKRSSGQQISGFLNKSDIYVCIHNSPSLVDPQPDEQTTQPRILSP
jgi:hypothetical protein